MRGEKILELIGVDWTDIDVRKELEGICNEIVFITVEQEFSIEEKRSII